MFFSKVGFTEKWSTCE